MIQIVARKIVSEATDDGNTEFIRIGSKIVSTIYDIKVIIHKRKSSLECTRSTQSAVKNKRAEDGVLMPKPEGDNV